MESVKTCGKSFKSRALAAVYLYEEKNYTIKYIAEKLGISYITVYNYTKGKENFQKRAIKYSLKKAIDNGKSIKDIKRKYNLTKTQINKIIGA